MREQSKSNDKRLQFLSNLSSMVTSVFDLDQLLELIIESVTTIMKARASSLLLLDKKSKKLYFQVATGEIGIDHRKSAVVLLILKELHRALKVLDGLWIVALLSKQRSETDGAHRQS